DGAPAYRLPAGSAPSVQPSAARSAPKAQAPPVGAPKVGSESFYLELGALYERYQDPATAAQNYALAVEKHEDPALTVQAYLGLARTKEIQGDKGATIDALEHALAEQAALPPGRPARMGPGGADDIVSRLGPLYVDRGDFTRAEKLYDKQLDGVKD